MNQEHDLIPVHLTVRPSDGVVSVRMLLATPVGIALVDGDLYKRIGQVREATGNERNKYGLTVKRKGWTWFYDEAEWGSAVGSEPTKRKAVEALLREGGYVEAKPDATNQGLF